MRTAFSRLVPLVLCLAVSVIAFAPPAARAQAGPAPTFPELTAEQWREDLRFMVAEMERRHPDLYNRVDRAEFAAAVADLDRRIPDLQRNQAIVGLMRLAAMIGDGHTRIDPRKDVRFGFPSLPLRLFEFDDGLYVRAAAEQQAALVGARVEAIGGIPVEEAIRRATELVARDNAMGPRLMVPLLLAMPDILHALGLSERRDSARMSLRRDGRAWTADVPAGAIDPPWPPDTDISLVTPEGWVDARRTPAPPLWLEAPLDYHRLVDLSESGALYVQLNMVTNVEGQSLAAFGRRIRARAAETNPRALILDLRLNQGGNGSLRNGFVRELIRTEDGDTRLFVLTARGTFSASQFILDDLDRLSDAVFVGEPASSKPSSYGDAYRMALPNSGISLRTSLYWWQSGQNRDPWTWVDLAAPLTFADYAAGRDPALEAALEYVPRPPLGDRLLEAARVGDVEAVISALAAWRADPVNRYANVGQQTIQAAEILFGAGHREAGLAVAELAERAHPQSTDAALVLAALAEAVGQTDLARRAADRVLALDPNNRFVRPIRERLAQAD